MRRRHGAMTHVNIDRDGYNGTSNLYFNSSINNNDIIIKERKCMRV